MAETLKEVIDELVADLRKAGCEADRVEAGSDLAVLLHQAERMITMLAARTPGPATAEGQLQQAREILATLCSRYRAGGGGLWDTVAVAESFLAEHGVTQSAQPRQS